MNTYTNISKNGPLLAYDVAAKVHQLSYEQKNQLISELKIGQLFYNTKIKFYSPITKKKVSMHSQWRDMNTVQSVSEFEEFKLINTLSLMNLLSIIKSLKKAQHKIIVGKLISLLFC
jgi:hypothetical protein